MSFNLSDAGEQKVVNTIQYQRPGVYDNTVITKVNLGKASTGSQYLQFETLGANGEIGKSPQMYLNNEAKSDGKPTAWSITARNLRNYIMNTHNVSVEDADQMIQNVETAEQLQVKVSALLVGRKFRAKFIAVQTSTGKTIAELGGSESMIVPKEESRLRYDEVKDFRPYKGQIQTTDATSTVEETSDLPF